ncbi:DUF4189 domain-containing protein [Streptacidiphilus sp. 4-A2]|nr:DUF4189 domain-containing protein [Streptacidiphilus sp. 4-A2]
MPTLADPPQTTAPPPAPAPVQPIPTTEAPAPPPVQPIPTTEAPAPAPVQPAPPPPPPPRPNYYGAIAVSHNGATGKAWNYGSTAAADQAALNSCPDSGCTVLTSFVNGCGAVAFNPATNQYWGGNGATPIAAEDDAISNDGGGHWTTYVCTTRYNS